MNTVSVHGYDPEGPFADLLLPPRFRARVKETRFKQRWTLTFAQYAQMMREFKGPKHQRGNLRLLMRVLGGAGDMVVLTNHTDTDLVFSGTAIAGFRFSGGGTLLLVDDADPPGEWWSAGFTPAIGDDYEVRALSAGKVGTWTNSGAADNTWVTMTAERRWDVEQSSIGTKTTSATFEVGLDGVESALDSATLTAVAIRDN